MNAQTVVRTLVLATLVVSCGSGLQAEPQQGLPQPVQPGQRPPERPPMIPARVDVVISRFAGDKKTATLPYSLMVNINGDHYNQGRTSIRMGVDVPVGTTTVTRDGVTTTQPSYRNVGTNIDCYGTARDDGRFSLYVNVVDASFVGGDPRTARVQDPAAFMTFSTSNHLTLRDGQTLQFTLATDKVTGEVVKVDVTLTVIK
jgi:hypothetical protein